MKLDLKTDQRQIRDYILSRIAKYTSTKNRGPGNSADPITLMTLGYYLEQTGYFALVFDTRPDSSVDGEWTMHIENKTNVVPFPKWFKAFDHLCHEGTVEVTLPSGKMHTLDTSDDNDSVAKFFGEILRDTVLDLRKQGAFKKLPLAPNAAFNIEEFNGRYGWPTFKKLRTLGRLDAK